MMMGWNSLVSLAVQWEPGPTVCPFMLAMSSLSSLFCREAQCLGQVGLAIYSKGCRSSNLRLAGVGSKKNISERHSFLLLLFLKGQTNPGKQPNEHFLLCIGVCLV